LTLNLKEMKKNILYCLLTLISLRAASQTGAEKEAVMAPIRQLFEGMKQGDSARVHGAFVENATLMSVMSDKNGHPLLRPEAMEKFFDAIGTAHAEIWNEMIWDVQVKVDARFAQAWANYAFYADKKFSHCGVDAFHLFKGYDGHWRIFHLADTRRMEGCTVPPSIQDQFK
jgi:hypothetical protein